MPNRNIKPLALLLIILSLVACGQSAKEHVNVSPWLTDWESASCHSKEVKEGGPTVTQCTASQSRIIDGKYLDKKTGKLTPFSVTETEVVEHTLMAHHCSPANAYPDIEMIEPYEPVGIEPIQPIPVYEPRSIETFSIN